MRPKEEIQNEINLIKAMKPFGLHKHRTQDKLDAIVFELEFGWDETAPAWNDLSRPARDLVMAARGWKNDENDDRPSDEWGGLVK